MTEKDELLDAATDILWPGLRERHAKSHWPHLLKPVLDDTRAKAARILALSQARREGGEAGADTVSRREMDEALLDSLEEALYHALYNQGPDVPYVGAFQRHTEGGTTLDGDFDLREAARAVATGYALQQEQLNG